MRRVAGALVVVVELVPGIAVTPIAARCVVADVTTASVVFLAFVHVCITFTYVANMMIMTRNCSRLKNTSFGKSIGLGLQDKDVKAADHLNNHGHTHPEGRTTGHEP